MHAGVKELVLIWHQRINHNMCTNVH